MAIIGKFEVTIASGGEILQEYNVATEDQIDPDEKTKSKVSASSGSEGPAIRGETVFKYVEAVPGLNFQIRYTAQGRLLLPNQDFLGFDTYIDGRIVARPIIDAQQLARRRSRTVQQEGKKSRNSSGWKMQLWCWTPLVTSDDRNNMTAAEIIKKYQNIGTIKVEVWPKRSTRDGKGSRTEAIIPSGPIPEKAMKGQALEVGVEFQTATPCPEPKTHRGASLGDSPSATFIFFYRSKNALQILHVIPRTPEPIPLEDRDEETLSPAEMLELIRRQKAERQAEKVKIKQEKADANLRRLAGIKREAAAEDDDEVSIVTQTAKKARHEVAVVVLLD